MELLQSRTGSHKATASVQNSDHDSRQHPILYLVHTQFTITELLQNGVEDVSQQSFSNAPNRS